jgi:hypothetical protein
MSGIRRIRCPVLIVHGTDDSVVPYQVTATSPTPHFPGVYSNFSLSFVAVWFGLARGSVQSAAAPGDHDVAAVCCDAAARARLCCRLCALIAVAHATAVANVEYTRSGP